MKSLVCLNCDEAVDKNYCSNCGQKTDTHRINFKHFLVHDILHGVWHVEKGILFTIKEALTRPGKASLDYISGKRIKYYNVFYLIVILVGVQLLLAKSYENLQIIHFPEIYEQLHQKTNGASTFLSDYSKVLILSLVPLFALNSFILFRKKKLNLSEHFILSGMVFLGFMLIVIATTALSFIEFLGNFSTIATIIDRSTPFLLLIYIFFAYYNAFNSTYSKTQLILRIVTFVVLLLTEIVLFLVTLKCIFDNL